MAAPTGQGVRWLVVNAPPAETLARVATPSSTASPGAIQEQPLAELALQGSPEQKPAPQAQEAGTVVEPKGKGQLDSDRVQNPHDPEATYAVKGQGEKKKEHVGYKVQVAETVCEAELAPGEPTRNFLTGIVSRPAHQSDEAGALQMEAEQAAMGLEKPPVQ